MAKIRSYTSSERQTAGMLCEFLHLYRGMRRAVGQMGTEAEQVVAEARQVEQLLVNSYGIKEHGLARLQDLICRSAIRHSDG